MANARIQFSTADESKWKTINPALREGELVVAKNTLSGYDLYLGGPGGSKFTDSVLVWSQSSAEKLTTDAVAAKNVAVQKANAATTSASAAAQSASAAAASQKAAAASQTAAKTSENAAISAKDAAKASKTDAASSAAAAKTSETNAANSQKAAKTSETNAAASASTATQKATAAANSADNANTSKNAAADSAAAAAASAADAKTSAQTIGSLKGVATQAEAEVGAVNNKVMTPLRVQEAIKKQSIPYLKGLNSVKSIAGSFWTDNAGVTAECDLELPLTESRVADWVLVQFGNVAGGEKQQFFLNGAWLYHRWDDNVLGSETWTKDSWKLLFNDGVISENAGESVVAKGVSYVRYANGLQICWGGTSMIPVTSNSVAKQTITFPLPFKDTSYGLSTNLVSATTGYADMGNIQTGLSTRTNTNYELAVWAGDIISAGRSPAVTWTAIGYWK